MSVREARGVHSEHPAIHIFARATVALVAIGAAVLSFDALTELAQAAGIQPTLAWIWAVVIDGFILVATLAAFALEKRSRTIKAYAWLCLAVFTIFSILGNGWHAAIIASPEERPLPIWVAVTVTAIPPVALFLAIHLLFIMITPTDKQREEWKRQEAEDRAREKERVAQERAAAKQAAQASKTAPVRPVQTSGRSPETLSKPLSAPAPTPASVQAPVPPVSLSAAPAPVSAPVVTDSVPAPEGSEEEQSQELVRQQVRAQFDQLLAEGKPLPGPAATARLLGRSPTSGSRFLAAYKKEHGLD